MIIPVICIYIIYIHTFWEAVIGLERGTGFITVTSTVIVGELALTSVVIVLVGEVTGLASEDKHKPILGSQLVS